MALRDAVSGDACDGAARNPLARMVDKVSGAPDATRAASVSHQADEEEAASVPRLDERERVKSRAALFARQFQQLAGSDLTPEEEADFQASLQRFNIEALEGTDLLGPHANSDFPAVGSAGRQTGDVYDAFPYLFDQENPFVARPITFEDAVALYDIGHLRDAVLALEALVQREPNSAVAWRWLGAVHAQNDEDKLAIASLLRAFRADPDNLDALLDLGVSFTNELAQEQALQYLQLWLSKHPKYQVLAGATAGPPTHHSVTQLFTRADEMANHTDGQVLTVLGVLYNLSREFPNAEVAFKQALVAEPMNHSLWNKLGATQANGLGPDGSREAVQAYRKALELKPNYVRAWVNMGISYVNQNKYDIGARYYAKALSQHSGAVHIWSYLSVALSCMGRDDLAERANHQDMSLLELAELR
jgi:peroxin-5